MRNGDSKLIGLLAWDGLNSAFVAAQGVYEVFANASQDWTNYCVAGVGVAGFLGVSSILGAIGVQRLKERKYGTRAS
jgi:hypothetical protein